MIALLVILALVSCLCYILAIPKQENTENTEMKEKSNNPTFNNTTVPSPARGASSRTTRQSSQTYMDLYHRLHNLGIPRCFLSTKL
jgi:cytoskeletal protein RodZ